MSYVATPTIDERSFIDVWQLREGVIPAEAYDDSDTFDIEGDPYEPLIAEDLKELEREESGHVAEVIMRQCDTKPILVRNGIESTCRYATPEQSKRL